MELRDIKPVLVETFSVWDSRETPRLGAALAFYAILSLAPLLIVVMAVVAIVFGSTSAGDQILNQVQEMIGKKGAEGVRTMIEQSREPATAVSASIFSLITLLFGASGVFVELRSALNKIWEVKPYEGSGIIEMIRQRIFSFGMVLAIGFLLLISLMISAGLATLGKFSAEILPIPALALSMVNFSVSFLTEAVLFALMFRYLPETKVSWKAIRMGALATAFLFTLGKFLIGFYLGTAAVGSAYGAAGSLVVIIIWVYYSSQIFYLGAEFTSVVAKLESKGSETAG